MKRLFDLTSALVALLLLCLPLAALTLLVRRKLGRPAFFRQVRPGLHGKPFEMLKFRSMTDARGPDGALLPDAERLSPFGRFLRASSLDELPGLWNVLKGDMSLVGPRPLLMEYLPLYSPEQARRHEVRPGTRAGRRSMDATRWAGTTSSNSTSGMWTTARCGWTSEFCGSQSRRCWCATASARRVRRRCRGSRGIKRELGQPSEVDRGG